MQFSAIFIAALAGLASAGPAVKRQNDCPEVDDIPLCGVSLEPSRNIDATAPDRTCTVSLHSCRCH